VDKSNFLRNDSVYTSSSNTEFNKPFYNARWLSLTRKLCFSGIVCVHRNCNCRSLGPFYLFPT